MVVIKDMEMPKNCAECKLFHFYFDTDGVIHFVCKCGNMEMFSDLKNKRNDLCPLTEVEIKAKQEKSKDGWCNTCKYMHHKSECLGCAKYDEYDNLITLSNYESEEGAKDE